MKLYDNFCNIPTLNNLNKFLADLKKIHKKINFHGDTDTIIEKIKNKHINGKNIKYRTR